MWGGLSSPPGTDRLSSLPHTLDPVFFKSNSTRQPTVMFLKAAPLDDHGIFNFGTSCSYHRALADAADRIVVEVNDKAPTCPGGEPESVPISEVTHVVETDNYDMPVLPGYIPATDDQKRIASYYWRDINYKSCRVSTASCPPAYSCPEGHCAGA